MGCDGKAGCCSTNSNSRQSFALNLVLSSGLNSGWVQGSCPGGFRCSGPTGPIFSRSEAVEVSPLMDVPSGSRWDRSIHLVSVMPRGPNNHSSLSWFNVIPVCRGQNFFQVVIGRVVVSPGFPNCAKFVQFVIHTRRHCQQSFDGQARFSPG